MSHHVKQMLATKTFPEVQNLKHVEEVQNTVQQENTHLITETLTV